jgi:hypothetical protein
VRHWGMYVRRVGPINQRETSADLLGSSIRFAGRVNQNGRCSCRRCRHEIHAGLIRVLEWTRRQLRTAGPNTDDQKSSVIEPWLPSVLSAHLYVEHKTATVDDLSA